MTRKRTRTGQDDHAAQPTQTTPAILATALSAFTPVVCLPSWIPLVRVIIIWVLAATLIILVRCQPDTITELLHALGH